jgi:hypothetical protein
LELVVATEALDPLPMLLEMVELRLETLLLGLPLVVAGEATDVTDAELVDNELEVDKLPPGSTLTGVQVLPVYW